jgi:Rrf2 family protein
VAVEHWVQSATLCSRTSRHALRALAELVRQGQGESMTTGALAAAADLPPGYLAKVMVALAKAGIVLAMRGRHGGYRLRRPPDETTLLDVVRLFDALEAPVACLLEPEVLCGDAADDDLPGGVSDRLTGGRCRGGQPCALHEAWRQLRVGYVELLGRTSLALFADACCAGPDEKGGLR